MIHEDTCLTDIFYIIKNNNTYLVYILLAILGTVIKLYDNIFDWKLKSYQNPLFIESLKYIMISVSTLTFLLDSESVFGIIALHILCLKTDNHGFDDPFFTCGIGFLFLFAVYHISTKRGISIKNTVEFILLAIIGYSETLLFKEEISDIKLTTRIFVVFILSCTILLDIFSYFKLFTHNIIQLFICGVFYLSTDIIMNIWLYVFDMDTYNTLKNE